MTRRDPSPAPAPSPAKSAQQEILTTLASTGWAKEIHRTDAGDGVTCEVTPRDKADGRRIITALFGEAAWFVGQRWRDFPTEPLLTDEAEYERMHTQ